MAHAGAPHAVEGGGREARSGAGGAEWRHDASMRAIHLQGGADARGGLAGCVFGLENGVTVKFHVARVHFNARQQQVLGVPEAG